MARDPNERIGPGQWLEKADDFKTLGIEVPKGYVVGTSTGQYYAHYNVHADGHTTIEWYKRGAGGGGDAPDPVEATTAGAPAKTVKDEWDKGTAKAANVYIGINPTTGKPTQVTESADGTKSYDDTQVPAGAAGSKAPPGGKPFIDDDEKAGASGRRWNWNPETGAYDKDLGPSPAAQRIASGQAGTTAGVTYETRNGAKVKVTRTTKDGETSEAVEPVTAKDRTAVGTRTKTDANGRTVKVTTYRYPDGSTEDLTDEESVAVKPNTTTIDGRMYEVVPGAEGAAPTLREIKNPNEKPPVDLPSLQLEAGNISSEVKTLWEDLNGKVRRGEITKQQAKEEFEGRYALAQTRMAEIKQTVDTQRGIFGDQVAQRGQDLSDIAGRRSAATSAAGEAAAYERSVLGKPGLGSASLSQAAQLPILRAQAAQQAFGGDRQVAPIQMGPAAAAANALPMPGVPSGAAVAAQTANTMDASRSAFGNLGIGPGAGPGASSELATPAEAARARLDQSGTTPAFSPTPTSMPGSGELQTPAEAQQPDMQRTALTTGQDGGGAGAIIDFELPGFGRLKINPPGQNQPASATATSVQPAPQAQAFNPNNLLQKMRALGGDDPSWQSTLDLMERQHGVPGVADVWG